MEEIGLRLIQPADNPALAGIIRNCLLEFNAAKPGTVYFDPDTDRLYEIFTTTAGSRYYVAEEKGLIVGGAGIFPTDKLPEGTVELVKFYLLPVARGKGIGKKLLEQCLQAARELGYTRIYLESMPELTIAIPLYEKYGFRYLTGPQGNSGHNGCDIWMMKELD